MEGENTNSCGLRENDRQLSLQKCILLLKGARNDNERFAALLLVAQLVNSNTVDSVGRRSLFEAVGFNFINRLLCSRKVPAECPHDVYRSLALSILACFATDEEFTLHPDMVSKIPLLLEGISNKEENDSVVADCYHILTSLASTSLGCRYLSEKETFSTLCQLVSSTNGPNSKKAFEIVVRIVNNRTHGVSLWAEQREILFNVLEVLCARFKGAQDKTKFDLCSNLVLLLAGAENSSLEGNEKNQWLDDVCIGVEEILRSKVSSLQRDPAIMLISLVIELVGLDSIMRSARKESPGLFVLSTTIACVETRMILDGNGLNAIIPKTAVLISCYNILEKAINFVIVNSGAFGSSTDSSLPKSLSKSLPKLYSLATEAMESIIQFLQSVACTPDHGTANNQTSQLVYASVRVLSAWMAEETSALQDSICELLPFLLKLAKESLDKSTECFLDARTSQREVSGTNSASHVSTVDANVVIKERSLRQVHIIRFLLPSLCHMSADEKMRRILIDNEALELLSRYYFQQLETLNEDGKADAELAESETCLVTLLGILLNLIVTESKLVIKNHAFQEISKHATLSVPLMLSSKKNVVFLFNLVMLGLLSLKSCVDHGVTMNTEEPSKFLQSSICLLKEARPLSHKEELHNTEHGERQLAAKCKEVWEDVAELWFLGLQVVSVLCGLLPVMRTLVKESGWIETITTHLNTCSHDQELTKDERDALVDLVREVNDREC